jgi:hypothetical protein
VGETRQKPSPDYRVECDYSPISLDERKKTIHAPGFSENPSGAIASLIANKGALMVSYL